MKPSIIFDVYIRRVLLIYIFHSEDFQASATEYFPWTFAFVREFNWVCLFSRFHWTYAYIRNISGYIRLHSLTLYTHVLCKRYLFRRCPYQCLTCLINVQQRDNFFHHFNWFLPGRTKGNGARLHNFIRSVSRNPLVFLRNVYITQSIEQQKNEMTNRDWKRRYNLKKS